MPAQGSLNNLIPILLDTGVVFWLVPYVISVTPIDRFGAIHSVPIDAKSKCLAGRRGQNRGQRISDIGESAIMNVAPEYTVAILVSSNIHLAADRGPAGRSQIGTHMNIGRSTMRQYKLVTLSEMPAASRALSFIRTTVIEHDFALLAKPPPGLGGVVAR